jgi:5'-3' exonuclease
MKKYIIVDSLNLFFRMKHVASRQSDPWEKVGMSLHMMFASVNQVVRLFGADHIVFCVEGRSWRKDFYEPYKKNRAVKAAALTEAEVEENKLFIETYSDFISFLQDKTNVSVLQNAQAEADDMIARFIHLHPDDEHFIISSDSDYAQLITDKVHQYNGVSGELIKLDGYYNDKGKPVIDKKTKVQKQLGNPEFVLFEKCMRGDSTDNVFSAYPGVRTKGTKNKVGLTEAFEDRHKMGFSWNNLMLQKWTDHNGEEHKVRDDYERNRILIDLKAQPDNIKQAVDNSVKTGLNTTLKGQVGIHLMRFAGKYDLVNVSKYADTYSKWLNQPYSGILKDE